VRKENRLASEADFRRVRNEGRSWAHPFLVVHARRSESPRFRAGIVVGKRCGGAVERNRIRRRIRELLRARMSGLPPGWDLVLTARQASARATFVELGAALDELLSRTQLAAP
jgi:ribonuclease P protein component